MREELAGATGDDHCKLYVYQVNVSYTLNVYSYIYIVTQKNESGKEMGRRLGDSISAAQWSGHGHAPWEMVVDSGRTGGSDAGTVPEPCGRSVPSVVSDAGRATRPEE